MDSCIHKILPYEGLVLFVDGERDIYGNGRHLTGCDRGRTSFDLFSRPRPADHVFDVDYSGLPNGLLNGVVHHNLAKKTTKYLKKIKGNKLKINYK